ncbi:unannotated protein [freshwater metagenome]|uniref:Unannotated protein n=1 Tax=freshwater metagenome TaxID=449393 RepID=A0A6J5ZER3_9ZZZZ
MPSAKNLMVLPVSNSGDSLSTRSLSAANVGNAVRHLSSGSASHARLARKVNAPALAPASQMSNVSGETQASCAHVTPQVAYASDAACTAATLCSLVNGGNKSYTMPQAPHSRKVPMGVPSSRNVISPSIGCGVSEVMPASSIALVLTQAVW